ncbi:MAG: diguanylate cyclase [Gallionellaceae bacterium]
MLLDNRTLLFSMVLVCAMMALSMTVVSWGREHDSLKKWAGAMGLEALAWFLLGARGEIPFFFSIALANTLVVTAQAMKLAAIYEFRGLSWPRWQCLLPIVLAMLLLSVLPYADLRNRIIYGSMIYAAQMVMIMLVMVKDTESRSGRAWWLLFGATAVILPLFALRSLVAYFGIAKFATPETSVAPNPVQLVIFMGLISLSVLGSMGFILMIKEQADRVIRKIAMIDSLTGMYNRRALMERGEKEYAFSQRNKLPLAVLMLDVDHFKRINDAYGHPTGDAVLVDVAHILASRLRKQDTLGRFGGEEFCIVLPATDEAGAMVLAEKLRLAIASTKMQSAKNDISITITISIGVTVCTVTCASCTESFQKLIDDADAALYLAKNDGRNRSVKMPITCCDIWRETQEV